jgi:hypothetical protein
MAKRAHRAKRGIHCSLDHLGEFGEEKRSENGGFGAACLGALVHGGRKEAWSFKHLCVECFARWRAHSWREGASLQALVGV